MTHLKEEFAQSIALSDWFHDVLSEEEQVQADRRRSLDAPYKAADASLSDNAGACARSLF